MKHLMTLWDDPFNMISCGQKDIEMRLYDEKRRKINVGDTIEFTNKKTNQKMEVIVINLHIYDSFEMLYSKFEKTRLGYKKDEIRLLYIFYENTASIPTSTSIDKKCSFVI